MEALPNDTPEPYQAPQALLITGDALRNMGPEQIETITWMLGELGLQTTAVLDLESLRTPEAEPEPVPVSKADFLQFARDNGHTDRMAELAWGTVELTADSKRHQSDDLRDFSLLRDKNNTPHVDLRAVYERLEQTEQQPPLERNNGWSQGSDTRLAFIRAICSSRFGFDVEPDEA